MLFHFIKLTPMSDLDKTVSLSPLTPPFLQPILSSTSQQEEKPQSLIIPAAPDNSSIIIKSLVEQHVKPRQRRDGHSMKDIATAIRLLLDSHRELTVRDLTNLLYELLCRTPLGKALSSGYVVDKRELAMIETKYSGQNRFKQCPTIKNIRRRLYDIINVMLAAGLIHRHKNTLQIHHQDASSQTIHQSQPYKSGFFEEIKKKESLLRKKRELLERTAKEYLALVKLERRNLGFEEEVNSFHFPLTVAFCDLKADIDLSDDKFKLTSRHLPEIYTEMNLIHQVCEISKEEVAEFLKK